MNERLNIAMNEWLCNYKKNSVKPATYDRLRISYDMMLRYDISSKNVCEITSDEIQNYLNQLVEDGYARSTIKKQFTLLTAFLKREYALGKIEKPVYLVVKLPVEDVVKKTAKNIEVYSEIEQKCLMNVLCRLKHRAYGALVLMLEAGLRSGEAQCLRWDDILWNQRAVKISKTLVRSSAQRGLSFVQNSAKSKASNRIVPLSNTAMYVLESLYTDSCSEFIFPSTDDSSLPISYCTVKHYLEKACVESGVRYRSTHVLRHTFATNCYHRGCNVKILSKLLGHADVSITYNIYIHLYGNDLEEMRKVIG